MVSDSNSPKETKLIKQLEKEMFDSVKKLEFEKAALLRDQINFLKDGTIPSKNKNTPRNMEGKKSLISCRFLFAGLSAFYHCSFFP